MQGDVVTYNTVISAYAKPCTNRSPRGRGGNTGEAVFLRLDCHCNVPKKPEYIIFMWFLPQGANIWGILDGEYVGGVRWDASSYKLHCAV